MVVKLNRSAFAHARSLGSKTTSLKNEAGKRQMCWRCPAASHSGRLDVPSLERRNPHVIPRRRTGEYVLRPIAYTFRRPAGSGLSGSSRARSLQQSTRLRFIAIRRRGATSPVRTKWKGSP